MVDFELDVMRSLVASGKLQGVQFEPVPDPVRINEDPWADHSMKLAEEGDGLLKRIADCHSFKCWESTQIDVIGVGKASVSAGCSTEAGPYIDYHYIPSAMCSIRVSGADRQRSLPDFPCADMLVPSSRILLNQRALSSLVKLLS